MQLTLRCGSRLFFSCKFLLEMSVHCTGIRVFNVLLAWIRYRYITAIRILPMPTHPVTQDTMSSNQISIQAALLEATADLESADALQKNLPDWLLKASPTSLSGLDQTAQALQLHRAKLESILNDLLPLKKFCSEKLSAALAKKWPVNFDVERDHLELPGEECGCPAIPSTNGGEPQFPLATRSLLDAAMQNFSAGEAMADGFPAEAWSRYRAFPPVWSGFRRQHLPKCVESWIWGGFISSTSQRFLVCKSAAVPSWPIRR
jgi:hypothetical protein